MMHHAAMMSGPQEPGPTRTKCRVTIGKSNEHPPLVCVGYQQGEFGALDPEVSTLVFIVYAGAGAGVVGLGLDENYTSLWYDGVEYPTGLFSVESAPATIALYRDWKSRIGQTVTVWLQQGTQPGGDDPDTN